MANNNNQLGTTKTALSEKQQVRILTSEWQKILTSRGIKVDPKLLAETFDQTGGHAKRRYVFRVGKTVRQRTLQRELRLFAKNWTTLGEANPRTAASLVKLRKLAPEQALVDPPRKTKKIAESTPLHLRLGREPETSEGPIGKSKSAEAFEKVARQPRADRSRQKQLDISKLPETPAQLWTFDFRGKSTLERNETLLKFMRNVYGPYLPAHKDYIREFLREKDPKLYLALRTFGFKNLPEQFQMPSRRERLLTRVQRAAAGEYADMTPAERRSVQWAVQTKKPVLKK